MFPKTGKFTRGSSEPLGKPLSETELKRLYGLKEKEHLKKYPRDEKGHIQKPMDSTEPIGNMSETELDTAIKKTYFSSYSRFKASVNS